MFEKISDLLWLYCENFKVSGTISTYVLILLPSYNILKLHSDAGRWKTLGGPVVIGRENLPSLVRVGLTDLQNIGGGPVAPLAPPVPAPLAIIAITRWFLASSVYLCTIYLHKVYVSAQYIWKYFVDRCTLLQWHLHNLFFLTFPVGF